MAHAFGLELRELRLQAGLGQEDDAAWAMTQDYTLCFPPITLVGPVTKLKNRECGGGARVVMCFLWYLWRKETHHRRTQESYHVLARRHSFKPVDHPSNIG